MPSASFVTPEGILSAHVDMVDITSMGGGPDKAWVYTDEQGHEHYYGDSIDPYPTLAHILDGEYYCADCRDDHTREHLECRVCGEVIVPGQRGGSAFRQYIPGRRWFALDGAEISPERFAELLQRYQGR